MSWLKHAPPENVEYSKAPAVPVVLSTSSVVELMVVVAVAVVEVVVVVELVVVVVAELVVAVVALVVAVVVELVVAVVEAVVVVVVDEEEEEDDDVVVVATAAVVVTRTLVVVVALMVVVTSAFDDVVEITLNVVGGSVVELQILQPVQSHSLLSCSQLAAPGGIISAISSQVLGSSGGPHSAGQDPALCVEVVVGSPV